MSSTPSWYLDLEADEAELDRRISKQSAPKAVTIVCFLANVHTAEIVEVNSATPDWFVDELSACGYVRFETFEAASDYMSACEADMRYLGA